MSKKKVQTVIFYTAADKTKHFLLLKMNERRGFFWQNVTGGVEKNENFEEAAIRESREETNIENENIESLISLDLEFSFVDQWKNKVVEKVFALKCKNEWEVVIDPDEHCEFKWVPENQITKASVHYETNYTSLKKAMKC